MFCWVNCHVRDLWRWLHQFYQKTGRLRVNRSTFYSLAMSPGLSYPPLNTTLSEGASSRQMDWRTWGYKFLSVQLCTLAWAWDWEPAWWPGDKSSGGLDHKSPQEHQQESQSASRGTLPLLVDRHSPDHRSPPAPCCRKSVPQTYLETSQRTGTDFRQLFCEDNSCQ